MRLKEWLERNCTGGWFCNDKKLEALMFLKVENYNSRQNAKIQHIKLTGFNELLTVLKLAPATAEKYGAAFKVSIS